VDITLLFRFGFAPCFCLHYVRRLLLTRWAGAFSHQCGGLAPLACPSLAVRELYDQVGTNHALGHLELLSRPLPEERISFERGCTGRRMESSRLDRGIAFSVGSREGVKY
jgi:hypothetical protein